MDVRILDEALFVVPTSGALWSYDFGRTKRVIHEDEATAAASDPPFPVAQARVAGCGLLLVFPTLRAPSIAQQDRIRRVLEPHVGAREVVFVLDEAPGRVALVGSDVALVEHVAAAAAVVRTCWGWDGSRAFTVNVDEFEFCVVPEFDGEVWTADPVLVRDRPRSSTRPGGWRSRGSASGGGAPDA